MKKLVLAFLLIIPFHIALASECSSMLDSLIKKYELNPTKTDILDFKERGQVLLDESFNERMKLHGMLSSLDNDCKIKLKDTFLKMREREDYIGAHFYPFPQISADSIDYKNIPLPIYSPESYAPYHLSTHKEKFIFKSGDILITKGVSFTSATISEVVSHRALFSHIVFIYVEETTQKVFTMESYIGYGVKIFPIEEALRNENARILVLRSKDSALAKKAASYMFERIRKKESVGERIPYDYALNFADNSKLSCEEIAYDAFKTVTDGKMILPENVSQVELRDHEFLEQMGLRPGALMIPADMEVDSRFDIVLDWTDYQVIRDSIRKDAVMGEVFHWMNEHEYKIHPSMKSRLAKLIWSTRYIPGLWHLMSQISGIPADFQKDVPGVAISTLESIKGIAKPILNFVTSADEEFFHKNGRWMTPLELRASIDAYLKTGPESVIEHFHK
jgi:hypothetical protein